jgi:predicted RNA binding protein YcfA (HicA-like mRNA interferase family)
MNRWPSSRARQVLAALFRTGWSIKRQTGGSHKVLAKDGWPDYVFAFHDAEEIGAKMLARIGKRTGLTPDDL